MQTPNVVELEIPLRPIGKFLMVFVVYWTMMGLVR
jgi:hypothetical protein